MKTFSFSFMFMLMALSPTLHAAGVGWLGDAPIRYFSAQDTAMMKRAVQQALSENDNGEILRWRNAESGHEGAVTPLDRITVDGRACRKLRLYNSAGGRTATSVFSFCRQGDAEWKLSNQ